MTEPKTISELIILVDKEVEERNYKNAISLLIKAIKIYPNSAELYNKIGMVKVKLLDFQRELGYVIDAYENDPEYKDYPCYLPFAKQKLEDNKGAIDDCHLKDFQGAIDDYTKAIEINPIEDVLYDRGLLRFEEGYFEGGCADWQKVRSFGNSEYTKYIQNNLKKYNKKYKPKFCFY